MASIGTAYVNIAPNMSGIQGKIAGGLRGSGSQFAEQFGGEVSGKSAVIIGAIAGIAQAGVTKAMNLVTSSISSAIRRVDTLNSAQKTFEYMGFAASDAAAATKAVTNSILGLPTPLDSAIRGMTSLAATYGDVKLGQKVFTALNDAILGFGGSAEMVDNAIQQVSQLPMDGPLDAQTWNSLRNSGITPVLVAMSKDMHRSVSQLKSDFGDGTLKVQDFVKELIKMDTKGGGGLVALNKIALNATSGISTGFANMQTSIARGLAAIIQAIGQKNISKAISTIGAVFEKALKAIAIWIPKVVKGIKDFFNFVNRNKDIFYPIAVGITAIVSAIIAWKTALFVWSKVTATAAKIQAAFNAVMAMNPIALVALAILGLVAGLTYFFTKTKTGQKVFADFTNFLVRVWDKVKRAIQVVADFLGTAWAASVGAVTAAFNKVRDTAKAVFDAIAGFIEKHKKGLIDIGIVITTILLPKIIAIGIEWLRTAGRATASFISTAASAVKNAIVAAAAWVKNAALVSAAWLRELPKLVWEFIKTSAESVKNATIASAVWIKNAVLVAAAWIKNLILMGLQFAWTGVQALLAAGKVALAWLLALGPIGLVVAAVIGATALIIANWNTVKGWLASFWNWLKNTSSSVWNGIKNGASSMINALIGFYASLPSRILRAIGNLGKLLYNSGRSLIQGLLDGAGSLLSSIGDFFLSKVPRWIKGAFKKALGINSPSTVFAGYGKNIVEGLAKGVDRNAGLATNSVNSMANDAMSAMLSPQINPSVAFGSTAAGSSGAYGNTSTTNQTVSIEKVILGDSSAVKEFFRQINQDTINVGNGLTPIQGAQTP